MCVLSCFCVLIVLLPQIKLQNPKAYFNLYYIKLSLTLTLAMAKQIKTVVFMFTEKILLDGTCLNTHTK